MDIAKFVVLSVGSVGGFIVTSYQGVAHQKGWPVGRAFNLNRIGWIAILGFLCQWGSVIISFLVNPWWTALLVLIIGFIGSMILTNVFKSYAQALSGMLILSSYILIPIIVFNGSSKSTTMGHFVNSINYANQATRLLNQGKPFTTIERAELERVMQYQKEALNEARQVDLDELNRVLEGFGAHYKNEFIKGLELFVDGFETNDSRKFLQGQVLIDQDGGSWYEKNFDRIRNRK